MKTAVVAGAAGFIGSHLCDFLIAKNYKVIGLDNFVTGREKNLAQLAKNPHFTLHKCDISQPLPELGPVDEIYNLASPASPVDFLKIPIFILQTSALGHGNLLKLAKANKARILFASTSEVYGDPLEHPQKESYWGNVNPIGTRGCYDEAKRFGEALTMAYHRQENVNTCIVRIFNTYGTRMRPEDGRVIPNFFMQALNKEGLSIYGSGKQTRSLCYVSDLVDVIYLAMQGSQHQPINIGNPKELTILEMADVINKLTGNTAAHVYKPLPPDDPQQRRPDITQAQQILKWSPKVDLMEGLAKTLEYFKSENLI